MKTAQDLYGKFFIDKGIERLSLFKNVRDKYAVEKVLYPGSFVHIAPSFYFPEVVYLDLDKRCQKFFSQKETRDYIRHRKDYPQDPLVRFYEMSFEEELEEERESFDLMISQYAGFISRFCTPYLKKKGILLANDSHGDATWAYCSGEYDLIGIVNDRLEIEEDNLDGFFTFPRKRDIDIDDLLKKMKGPKYRKMANSYVFQKK